MPPHLLLRRFGLRPFPGNLLSQLPAFLIACGFLVSLILAGEWPGLSGLPVRFSEATHEGPRALQPGPVPVAGATAGAAAEEQGSCHSPPPEAEPFRRASGSAVLSKAGSAKVRWITPTPGSLQAGLPQALRQPETRGHPASGAFQPSASPFSGRYPVFLLSDLPPPSLG